MRELLSRIECNPATSCIARVPRGEAQHRGAITVENSEHTCAIMQTVQQGRPGLPVT